jgi:CheY-like chemotaxis protein
MQKFRVLVAEDDDVLRETIAELLRLEGYVVESAANGAQALASLMRSRPAVMLLDMHMPILDGWGLAREMEANGLEVPVVVMTGADHPWFAAAQIRAEGWLEKPFKMKELRPAIERLCA